MKLFFCSLWLMSLLLADTNTYAQTDSFDDIKPWLDITYELTYKDTVRPVDQGKLYTLPTVRLHLVDENNNPAAVTDKLISAFSDLVEIQENDYAEVSVNNNNLHYSLKPGYLSNNINETAKTFIYDNLLNKISACLGTLSTNEAQQFEDYILDPQGNKISNIGRDEAIKKAKPIANKMYQTYKTTLCRTEGTGYELGSTVKLYMKAHLEALLQGNEQNLPFFGSDLLSLSPVFDDLLFSTNSGIYMRLTRALLIDRFRNSTDKISNIDDILQIKQLDSTNYENYLAFILDDKIPLNFRESVVGECDKQNSCFSLKDSEFNIGSCVTVPYLVGITGFNVAKVLLTTSP